MDIQKEKTAIQYLKLMGGGENDPYPKYKSNYIKAFERMIERRKEKGEIDRVNWSTGEAVFNWWLRYDDTQLKFEGFEDF